MSRYHSVIRGLNRLPEGCVYRLKNEIETVVAENINVMQSSVSTTILCPNQNCKTANTVGAKFCGECGKPMAAEPTKCRRPSCNVMLNNGTKFCQQCGYDQGKVSNSMSFALSNCNDEETVYSVADGDVLENLE